jgi:hypothetical protein
VPFDNRHVRLHGFVAIRGLLGGTHEADPDPKGGSIMAPLGDPVETERHSDWYMNMNLSNIASLPLSPPDPMLTCIRTEPD